MFSQVNAARQSWDPMGFNAVVLSVRHENAGRVRIKDRR